jgi:hypothetical protein
MALLARQTAKVTGTVITFASASGGGDTVAPDPFGVLHVRNASGGTLTVTVVVPGNTQFGQAQPDVAVAVAAGASVAIGPLSPDLADPATGLINITYSGVTSLTVAAVTTG